MFYSHDILQRRGGKFGVIWIAATKAASLSKRDYFSVSIVKTCEDIMLYLTRQGGGTKGPRLSLYLSSQLMFGVTRVFQKQYDYLVVEVHSLHQRFSASKLTARVFQGMSAADIELPRRPVRPVDACTLPEPNLEEYESEFGMLRLQEGALEPFLLPTIEMFSLSPSQSGQPTGSSSSPQPSPYKRLKLEDVSEAIMRSPHTVSSADEIRLKDNDAILLSPLAQEITVPGEQDLPTVDMVEGDIPFVDQLIQDEQLLEVQEEQPLITSPVRPDQTWLMDETTGEVLLSPDRPKLRKPGAKRGPRKEQKGAVPDVVGDISPLVSDQGVQVSDQGVQVSSGAEELPIEDRPEMHTPKAPAVIPILRLAPLDEAETPSPRRRGKKRRLVFADEVLKLSKDDIRHNMSSVGDLTLPEEERYAVASTYVEATVKEMFQQPARKAMRVNPTMMGVWNKQAKPYVPSEASYSDEEMRPVWSIEYLRERTPKDISSDSPGSQEKSPELSSIQLARGISISKDTSSELLRGPDASADLSTISRAPFEDTPSSIKLTDISNLSDDRSSRGSGSISGLKIQRPKRARPVEDIPEEDQVILDMGELLLEGAGLLGDEPVPQQVIYIKSIALSKIFVIR
ncbi:uncharacterized protein [Amphiura filiformis]|uniref:uncharacterized protein n=1 Tax=Amphiura filiformis TaxID=82378 RepID=UPI003B2289B6